MVLKLDEKKAIVAEVKEVASHAQSAVTAENRGLTVAQMTKLRAQARSNGVYLRVVRNTLARLAVKETGFACLDEALVGPLLLAFSKTEPGSAARLLRDFSKENEKLVVTALSFGGKLLPAKDIDKLANLPTLNEALSQLLAVMKAPITKLACTIKEPHAKLVRTHAAYRDQRQAAGA